MKIAVLEDNPPISDYLTNLLHLEEAENEVVTFTQGAALLDALVTPGGAAAFDLALIDLLLPGALSGQEVIQHIRQTCFGAVLPLIVISGLSLQELEQVAQRFPAVPVLQKPFKARALLSLIRQLAPQRN